MALTTLLSLRAADGSVVFCNRHIAESHGGSIWVESDEGQGSAFTFTLPIAETP